MVPQYQLAMDNENKTTNLFHSLLNNQEKFLRIGNMWLTQQQRICSLFKAREIYSHNLSGSYFEDEKGTGTIVDRFI
jgi:hypothetical protein